MAGDELGDVTLQKGFMLTGRVREADGVRVNRAFVAVSRDGERVAQGTTEPGGAFSIGPLDDGEYEMQVFPHESEGVAGWRIHTLRARPGAEPLDVVVPTGLRILLRDAKESPVATRDASTEIVMPGREGPWKETFNASVTFTELRMHVHPGCELAVTVRVAGFEPVTETVTADSEGDALLELRLVPRAR